jgi:hypothetical protein
VRIIFIFSILINNVEQSGNKYKTYDAGSSYQNNNANKNNIYIFYTNFIDCDSGLFKFRFNFRKKLYKKDRKRAIYMPKVQKIYCLT